MKRKNSHSLLHLLAISISVPSLISLQVCCESTDYFSPIEVSYVYRTDDIIQLNVREAMVDSHSLIYASVELLSIFSVDVSLR